MHDGTFQKIEERDDDACGPRAVLVCGFPSSVEPPLREILNGIGAAEHRVVLCTPAMVKLPLGEALAAPAGQPADAPAAPDALPRVVVLSGLSGAQLQGFLAAYRASGLPSPIFASTTPPNLSFPVGKLVVELLREQREMGRPRRGR
jgi:hypothetical protein